MKYILLILIPIFFIGCNDINKSSKERELPTVTISLDKKFLKQSISDIETIKSQDNKLSFAYYTANNLTQENEKRWYISQIDGSLKGYVFSLMPIVDGKAGWGEVGKGVASIDIYKNSITIGYIPDNSNYTYRDWGRNQTVTDPIIQEDIELIRNSTVDIKWWFFKASNDNWYIVNEKSIYRFGSKDGAYDWQKIDLNGLTIKFFIENGQKKMKLIQTLEETPQLNLHHKSETKEIKKQNGCNFDDIYPNMFSSDKNEENYIRAICQAGVMQGDEYQTSNFRPFNEVDRYTVAKVTSLVYDYEGVTKFCANDRYSGINHDNCYLDYAQSKGFKSTPKDETIRQKELYIYLVKLFWNKNVSDKDEAWQFLKDKGVLLKADLGEPAGQLYVPDFMEKKLLRWELATLVMRSSRIAKEQTASIKGGELPYAVTPDNEDIDDIDILELLAYLLDISVDELKKELFEDNNSEERENAFFIPKDSLPKTVDIKNTPSNELPNAIVDTASKNIGKTVPYVDGKNSVDTRLITTVYGQEVKHETAKDMCKEYEKQGKLEIGLPTDKDLKGYVACYKDDTPGTDGKGHVAIIADSKAKEEIGVQDTQKGVTKRPIDKKNIKGVIAPKDIDLPTF